MGTPTPFFWSDADGGKFIQLVAGEIAYCFNLASLEVVDPPVFTSTPVISGTGVVGSPISVTDATYTTTSPATLGRSWNIGGVEVSQDTNFNFPGPAGSVVRMRNVVVNEEGGAAASNPSNELTTIEDAGAVPFPAQLASTSWAVVENNTTPEVQVSFDPGTGFTLDTVNFDYYWVCILSTATTPADITKSTKITDAVNLTPRVGARDAGLDIVSTLYIKRKSDGEERNATVGNISKTQELVGTGGGTVAFAPIPIAPNPGKAEAISKSYSYYNLAGSNMQNVYHARVAIFNALLAYRDPVGNVAAVTWTIGQIKKWCTVNQASQYEGAYRAQWELIMSCVAYIALRTPTVMSGLTTAEKAALPLAIECGLYTGAALMNDNAQAENWQVSLRGRNADYASVNPNIGAGSPALVHIAEMHFGPTVCQDKIWAYTTAAWQTSLSGPKDADGNIILKAAKDTYNLAQTDVWGYGTKFAKPPTNSQITTWFGNDSTNPFKMRKLDMRTQLQASILKNWNLIFGGNADGGEDNVGNSSKPTVILPGVKSNKDGLVKVIHTDASDGRRGGFKNLTDANYTEVCAKTPFFNERGCIKEMNAVDSGPNRSTTSYAINSMHIWLAEMACLMVATQEAEAHFNWWDWRDDAVIEKLERARRGCVHMRFCTDKPTVNTPTYGNVVLGPYLNCAKALEANANNSETWDYPAPISGTPSLGSKFALNATFGFVFDVVIKWLRDSDILPDLSSSGINLAQWEAPVNWTYPTT